jgi:hypothetical protein
MLPAPTEDAVISQLACASWYKPTITYAFIDQWSDVAHPMVIDGANADNFRPITGNQKAEFAEIYSLWDDLIAPPISAATSVVTADIKIAGFNDWFANSSARMNYQMR